MTAAPELVVIVSLTLVASVLAGSAVLAFAAPAFVVSAQNSLRCPRGLVRSAAAVQIVAAAFLIVPETRIWGIAAATGIFLAGLVILLCNGRLVWCVPGLVLLGALVPVTLAL